MKIFDIFQDEDDLAGFLESADHASGCFSKVYYVTDNLVIKETEDAYYMDFLKCAALYPNRHFPVIYDVTSINETYYILMERLEGQFSAELMEICQGAEMGGYWEKDSALWRGLHPSLNGALDSLDLYWEDNKHLVWDLRASNIMKRKDGTYVITDPWAESNYK